jgi:hypothetical protein
MKKSASVWQFVLHRDGSSETWVWRRADRDGALEEMSPPHDNFGKAIADALAHGFQPRRQLWETRSGNWITRFTPGRAPISMRDDSAQPLAIGANSTRNRAKRNPLPPGVFQSLRAKPPAAAGNKPPPARKRYSRRP